MMGTGDVVMIELMVRFWLLKLMITLLQEVFMEYVHEGEYGMDNWKLGE